MPIQLSTLTRVRSVVSNTGTLTQEASFYFQQIEQLLPVSGDGSPEGVIDAQAGRTYYDLSGGTGDIIYIKTVDEVGGDTKLGWVLA